MKKYLYLIKNALLIGTAYNAEAFNWFLLATLGTISAIIIFQTASNSGAIINYTKESITLYIILGLVVERFAKWYFSWELASGIQSGRFSINLVKPISTPPLYILNEFGRRLITTTPYLIIIFIFFQIMGVRIYLPFQNFIYFLVTLILASLLNIAISLIFSYSAFWITRINAFHGFFEIVSLYLAGRAFPIDIVPKGIQSIIYFTPFPFTHFAVLNNLTKNISFNDFSKVVIIQILWIIGLNVFANFMWKKGIKKHESVGI